MLSRLWKPIKDSGRREQHDEFTLFEPDRSAAAGLRRRRLPRRALLLAVVLAGASASAYFAWKDFELPPSDLPRVPPLDATPGGERQRESDRYRETLQAANEINADQAYDEGNSFISVPEATLEGIVTIPPREFDPWTIETPAETETGQAESEPSARREIEFGRPDLPELPAEPRSANSISAEENPYLNLALGQMNALAGAMAIPAPASVKLNAGDSLALEAKDSEGSNEMVGTGRAKKVPEIRIPAGEILYAETLLAVDSRLESPVAAVVVQGPLKGARVLGGFTAHPSADGLYLNFDRLVDPNGDLHNIEAVGIDGITAKVALASDIHDALLPRLGPLMAASFLSDVAAHASRPRRTAIEFGGNSAIVSDKPSIRESFFAGVAGAADRIKSDLEASASSGPVISLKERYPIGVLFLTPAGPETIVED
ncbi:MAG: hypothetical protein OXC26_16315 [Albidovulum sp.]|nr:hypothetical protein [Albidovulum sp.]